MAENTKQLEKLVVKLLKIFDVDSPPIPLEFILQNPKEGMWEKVDITQISGGFLNMQSRYSPRMSLARLLTRHIAVSNWGREHGLLDLIQNDPEVIQEFARILAMPTDMVFSLSVGALNPTTMSLHFEVPEEDARLRLEELL